MISGGTLWECLSFSINSLGKHELPHHAVHHAKLVVFSGLLTLNKWRAQFHMIPLISQWNQTCVCEKIVSRLVEHMFVATKTLEFNFSLNWEIPRVGPYQENIHSRKITWNTTMKVWKMISFANQDENVFFWSWRQTKKCTEKKQGFKKTIQKHEKCIYI